MKIRLVVLSLFLGVVPLFAQTDKELSELDAVTSLADGDLFLTTDVSDTSASADGTSKKITFANIKLHLQPLDADLTALAALSGTSTIYYRSAANTWTAVTIGSGLSFSAGTLDADAAITRDTEWDTIAEIETAAGAVNILLETEIDASSELLALMDDETGTGALVFGTSPTIAAPTFSGTIAGTYTIGGTPTFPSSVTLDTEWDTIAELETVYSANLLVETEIDASSELLALMDDETGTGALVFATSPAFTTNFTLANAAAPTTSAVAQMAFDTNAHAASRGAVQVHDGTASTWLVGALATDTPTNGQVPKWNTGGTITWEDDANSGSATAWDSIGDPAGAGSIAFAGTEQDITSTLDSGDILTITNTDADAAADTTFLKLAHNDGADANVIFIHAIGDLDGTPADVFKLTETALTIGVDTTVGTVNTTTFAIGGTTVTASGAELNFVDGVTSAIQTQLDAKALAATTITIAGTANEITSSAGAQSLAANRTWTLSLPSTIDLGGKTSLEIPNSDDPDVDAAGEIGWDTDGWLRAYDGTNQVAIARKIEAIHCTVVLPNDLADSERDAFWVWSNESGMSFIVTGWKAWSDTDDTTLNIEEIDADGANNATVDAVEIATNGTGLFSGADTTITAATIENGHLLVLDFDDTDTPGQVKIVVYGYYNADVN